MIVSRGGDSCRDCKAKENDGHHHTQENGWRIVANKTLHEAMINERSKQWRKVIANYTELLEMLSRENPTDDQERPSWLTLLLYECHYHLGVALQRINQPKKAIEEFTKAIDAVSSSRSGCAVSCCRLPSCLMTPIYARRAFVFAHSGDMKNAALDAEKAVVYDSGNPDVYCIRALVLSTCNKTTQAVEDLGKALKLNGNHCCALILQGAMRMKIHKNAKDVCSRSPNRSISEEHLKAAKLNPDSRHFLTVDNFRHQQIHEFYDKFLCSLRVPHTVLHLTTTGDDLSQVNKPEIVKRELLKPEQRGIQSASSSSHRDSRNRDSKYIGASDATCQSTNRRHSATPNINSIGKRLYSNECDDHSHCNKSHRCVQLTPTLSIQRRRTYGQAATKGNANSNAQQATFNGNVSDAKQKTMTNANGIQILQGTNLSEIRRLYYKPWMGDRLPVTERERKQRIFLPFKV